jgi:hypothetical protein
LRCPIPRKEVVELAQRMNVLFTRARQRVVLFSSMGSDDVLVTPTTKRGVRVLRDYLRYVESRRLEVGIATGRDFDSDFERDVRSRLETRGFVVASHNGDDLPKTDKSFSQSTIGAIYIKRIVSQRASAPTMPDTADRADRRSLRTHAPYNLSGHLRPNSPPIMPPIRLPGPPPPPLR